MITILPRKKSISYDKYDYDKYDYDIAEEEMPFYHLYCTCMYNIELCRIVDIRAVHKPISRNNY